MKNVILTVFVLSASSVNAQKWNELSFKSTLEKHLNAISQKDLEVIKATVADSHPHLF